MLELKKIKQIYDGEVAPTLDGVSFKTANSGLYFLTGENENLSLLLSVVAGITPAMDGIVVLDDEELINRTSDELSSFRRDKMAYIPRGENLVFGLTVRQNIELGLNFESEEIREKLITEGLYNVNLPCYEKTKVENLTEIQRKKIAIARASIKKPRLVILDEPFFGDFEDVVEVFSLLENLAKNSIVLIATSELAKAVAFCDTIGGVVLTLDGGKIVAEESFAPSERKIVAEEIVASGEIKNEIDDNSDIDAGTEAKAETETINETDILTNDNTTEEELSKESQDTVAKNHDEKDENNIIEVEESIDENSNDAKSQAEDSSDGESNADNGNKADRKADKIRKKSSKKINCKRTNLAYLAKISVLQLVRGKARLATLVILLVFALTSAGLGVGAAFFYNSRSEQLRVYKKSGQEISFTKNADIFSSEDIKVFSDSEVNDISNKYSEAHLAPLYYTGSESCVIKGMTDIPKDGYKMEPYGYTVLDETNFRERSFSMFLGSLPIGRNEVALTKFIAESALGTRYCTNKGINALEDFVGKTVRLGTNNNVDFTVTGIIDTHADAYYEEVKEKVKKNNDDDSREVLKKVWDNAMSLSVHRAVVVSTAFLQEVYAFSPENALNYKSSEESTTKRTAQMFAYTYAKDIQKSNIYLVGGKTTISDGEIVLTKNAVKSLMFTAGSDINKITDEDIKAKIAGGLYVYGIKNGEITLTDPLKVVGFIESTTLLAQAILSDNQFNALSKSKKGIVSYSCFLADKNITSNLRAAKYFMKSDVLVNSFMSADVAAARTNAMIIGIVCGSLGGFLLLAFFIVSVIGTFWSMGENGKNNSKLRAIGISEKLIKSIYVMENLVIAISSFLISLILIFAIAPILSFAGKSYSLLLSPVAVNIPVVIILFAVTLVSAFIGSTSAIYKRKKT